MEVWRETFKLQNREEHFARTRHKINRALRDYERSIASKIKSDPRRVYNYINSKKTVVNGIKALRLHEYVFKVSFFDEIGNNDIEVAPKTTKIFKLDMNKSFSQKELTKRFASLEPRKAVGPDEFNPYVLRECAKSLALPLKFIFKKSFTEMRLPKIWKRANLNPLFKSESKLNVKNYRPVSLTCIPGKSKERVIRDRMVEYLAENYLICNEISANCSVIYEFKIRSSFGPGVILTSI